MRVQISLIILLLGKLSCHVDQDSAEVKVANAISLHYPWHEHTLVNPDQTVDYVFIPHEDSRFGGAKEMCVALEVESDSVLKKAYDANKANPYGAELHKAFLTELGKAKILCVARYRDNRNRVSRWRTNYIHRNAYSYFDGEKSHRVNCWTKNRKFICQNNNKQTLYEISNTNTHLNRTKSVTRSIVSIGERYSTSRKMLGVRSSLLTRQQKAFYPGRSWEQGEYKYTDVVIDGNQQRRFTKVIKNEHLVAKKTGQPILPECSASEGSDGSINVAGFERVNECLDELSPYDGFCKFWNNSQKKSILNTRKINACKLNGRGILIRKNDNIMRVTSCEYQHALQHFYCSGKLEKSDQKYKVYFERYGVELPRRRNTPNCPEKQILLSGHGGSNFSWDDTTTPYPQHTVHNRFINVHWSDKSKQVCVALDVEPDGDLMVARQKSIENNNNSALHTEYLKQVSLAKVLCIAKYKNDLKERYMYSYYTVGSDGEDLRAVCWTRNNDDFVCKGEDESVHVIVSAADVKAKFGGSGVGHKILKIKDYDRDKKMLRLRGSHLASKQKVIYPYSSREKPEFDYRDVLVDNREQRRYVQVIETIRSRQDHQEVLPLCQGSGNNITGFAEKKVCASELGVFGYYCNDRGDATVNICKMEKGQGVLIREDNGNILRVVSCEYQSAANHFYCSGKIGKDGNMKVYFERYGVYRKKVDIATLHSCPDTETKVEDANGNDVPAEIVEAPAPVVKAPAPVVEAPQPVECEHEDNINNDNCVCNPPRVTHGGICLDKCPADYEQDGGNGCNKVAATPPAPSVPACNNGQAILGNDANSSDDNCQCVAPMHDSGGLCCESGKENKDGACVELPKNCDLDKPMVDDCVCASKTYNSECLKNCPAGTEDDDNDGTCIATVNKCGVGDDVSSGCDCDSSMKQLDGHCCETRHTIYKDNKCQECTMDAEMNMSCTD